MLVLSRDIDANNGAFLILYSISKHDAKLTWPRHKLITILKCNRRNKRAHLHGVARSQCRHITNTLPTDGLISLASDGVFGERPKFNSPLVKPLNQVNQEAKNI